MPKASSRDSLGNFPVMVLNAVLINSTYLIVSSYEGEAFPIDSEKLLLL
jgi:hypothetical protein